MINYIQNLVSVPLLYFRLYRKLKYQQKFIQNTLFIDIQESKITNDNSLNNQDYKKILNYYGYAVPSIFGESYCILRGYNMTSTERSALTYLGGVTGLFDDFFDKKDLSESYIKELIENPDSIPGNNSYEKLILKLYGKALKNIANLEFVKSQFLDVYNAEIQSKRQKYEDLNRDEITEITLNKGGVSTLLFRNIFSETPDEAERMMFYKLGGLFQLENDIFDVYKDNIEGIKTLVTTENKINNLRETYISLYEEIFDLVQQTNYPLKNLKTFNRIIYLVFCRGLVCLDMLEKNEKSTNNVFDLANYQRHELICDMEKPCNFFKTINYYSKYNFENN